MNEKISANLKEMEALSNSLALTKRENELLGEKLSSKDEQIASLQNLVQKLQLDIDETIKNVSVIPAKPHIHMFCL